MQETEQLIALYHTGFIICLILTILFAIVSIAIFFLFKIRKVFDVLTGRAEKRIIRQMEEENAQTGKLRRDTYVPEVTGDLYTTPSGSVPPVIYPPTGEVATGGEPTEKMRMDVQPVQDQTGEGSEATTLLDSGSEETTLLNGEPCGTTLLTPEMMNSQQEESRKKPYSGRFEIIKEEMLIHTEERI